MSEPKFIEQPKSSLLTNPTYGRIYLKTALDKDNERDFMQALHQIVDSLMAQSDGSELASSTHQRSKAV